MERPQPDTLHPAAQDTDRSAVIRSTYRSRSASAPSATPGAVGDQRVSGSTQGRTRPGYDRIAEPTARMEAEQGYNLILLPAGGVSGALYDLCDRYGFYVVEQAPINTSRSGMSRRKGGNPSNDPAWQAAYIARIEESYHTTKLHPCVVAFSLAEDSANGINLYEALSPPQGPRKGAPGSLPRCRRRVEQRQTPAVGRTIRFLSKDKKRLCQNILFEKSPCYNYL